jgi:hypothetical protein
MHSKTRIYHIRLHGTVSAVTATFYPGNPETREQPGEPASAEISSVVRYGVQAVDDMTDQEYNELETAWLERYFEDMNETEEND